MSHDVRLVDGDLPHLTGPVRGDDLTMQRARVRLRTFRGEWVLDAAAGLPYLDWAQRKTPAEVVALAVAAELEATPGVKRADLRAVVVDRALTLSGTVTLDDGDQRGVVVAPFGVYGDPLPRVA